MDRTRNRWLLRFAVVLIVGVGILIWSLRQRGPDVLTLVNESGQTITSLEVKAGEQSITFRDIRPDGQETVPFVTRGDTTIRVAIRLEDKSIHNYIGPAGENLRRVIKPGGEMALPAPKR